jgi:hypothetical protein
MILFAVVGLIVTVEEYLSGTSQSPILSPLVSVLLLVIGVSLFRAGQAKYPLSWPLAIGVGLAFFGLAMVLDDILGGKTQDLAVGIVLGVIFLCAGILLMRSGRASRRA